MGEYLCRLSDSSLAVSSSKNGDHHDGGDDSGDNDDGGDDDDEEKEEKEEEEEDRHRRRRSDVEFEANEGENDFRRAAATASHPPAGPTMAPWGDPSITDPHMHGAPMMPQAGRSFFPSGYGHSMPFQPPSGHAPPFAYHQQQHPGIGPPAHSSAMMMSMPSFPSPMPPMIPLPPPPPAEGTGGDGNGGGAMHLQFYEARMREHAALYANAAAGAAWAAAQIASGFAPFGGALPTTGGPFGFGGVGMSEQAAMAASAGGGGEFARFGAGEAAAGTAGFGTYHPPAAAAASHPRPRTLWQPPSSSVGMGCGRETMVRKNVAAGGVGGGSAVAAACARCCCCSFV
jgi:hypothetical protein